MAHPARLVEVVRSGLIESVHRGSVAVCDPEGRLLAWTGDPDGERFARSAMKPLQAAVSLSVIGDALTDAEVAVMCGSHSGDPDHLAAVESILRRAGLGFDGLRTPPALPAPATPVTEPEPRFHNCSGKHAGMLLACVRGGWPVKTYREPSHPLQVRILEAVRAATGAEPRLGVDGCGLPVHAVPLRAMATLFARLAAPEHLAELEAPARRAAAAMLASPHHVAGRGRFCTRFMQCGAGIAVKYGAEGLLCAAVPHRRIGVAVTIDDGAERACGPALLRALDLLDVPGLDALPGDLREPPVLGGGEPVGSLRAGFDLDRA